MHILIAGFGSIGRRHFRNLLALGKRSVGFYRTGRSTLPDDELQGFPVFTDLDEALAQKPAAVVVANPTALHLDVAIPAARAGCHLLLDKPVSHSMERIDELQKAVRDGGGAVLVGFQFRFHPGLRKAAELWDLGAIGRPLSLRAHWGEYLPDWHPWEDYRRGYSARQDLGGGVILTLCHPLDYARWLLGEISNVWAFSSSGSDLSLEVEDTAEIGLRFAAGPIGSVHLNYTQQPPAHHLEIVGGEGTLRWDAADGALQLARAGREGWEIFPPPPDFKRNHLFLDEMRHFLAVMDGEEGPACSLEDGLAALRLALAAHRSARTGQQVSLGGG
jgi:predicted dehydrogenase